MNSSNECMRGAGLPIGVLIESMKLARQGDFSAARSSQLQNCSLQAESRSGRLCRRSKAAGSGISLYD